MKYNYLSHSIAMGVLAFNVGLTHAASGNFSTLTYNVAGLPEFLSSADSNRQEATEQISCYVNEFSFVNVQEDFNYHAALYDTCNTHTYRSPTTGGAGFGSGLNSMSYFPYMDWARVRWNNCNGVDCLTPKGFTMARTRLDEGVYVDIYNLHTQAQVEGADLSARRANIIQLAEYIESQSAGNAVIVMGDTNTRYTRSGDNMWELLRRGFTDLWVSKIRNGDVPAPGADALVCSPAVTRPDCEIVDKILFRDNGYVNLEAVSYAVREDAVNSEGVALSDHPPVEATWIYSTASNRQLSDQFGGPHGYAFNDVSLLPENPAVSELSIRVGDRIDNVAITLSTGYVFSHGGSGGNERSLTLNGGEYLTSVNMCSGKENDWTRIFYAQFTTSDGRTLSGGTMTSNCTVYTAPPDWQIVGFHGRSGDEVDKLGVVYAPRSSSSESASYFQLVNNASGLCMDVLNAEMVNGKDVIQWHCNGGDWQKWSYDENSGFIRSKQDPRFCLDNSGSFANGANIMIWRCNGNANQRFTIDGSGAIRLRTYPQQVVDGRGTEAGDTVGTWSLWGGDNQHWTIVD